MARDQRAASKQWRMRPVLYAGGSRENKRPGKSDQEESLTDGDPDGERAG